MNSPPISATLAHFVAHTRYEQLPRTTVESTKRCLLDALGVSMAATTLGEGVQAFADFARAQGGSPTSTVLGGGFKTSSVQAALVNGALAHALDFEDAHDQALVHPNAASVPVALAIAEALGTVNGKQLITALAIGCDVVCRMGLALRVPLDDFGWYPPPILGAFGATATAAHLLGLNELQVLDAFSLTLCQATCSAEIKYNPQSVIRAVRDSFAAKTGVLSAELAQRGVSGFNEPLEGKAGFFALFARGQYEPDELLRELGTRFEIDNISFKPWPTCRGTHVFIEMALQLAREHALKPADIATLETTGSRINRMLAEPIESKRAPSTAIDAKFSIPFAVATALTQGDVTLAGFSPSALTNAATLQLAQRVSYDIDPTDDGSPGAMTRGSLTIRTHDGREFVQQLKSPLGNPERPLDDTALINKFIACAAHYRTPLAESKARQLADTIFQLDLLDNALPKVLSYL
jgi:2-methylcitrate dehydratase PrpD